MKRTLWPLLALIVVACQPSSPGAVTLIDGQKIVALQSSGLSPAALVQQAGWTLAAGDQIDLNGIAIPADTPLPAGPGYTLQIRRAVPITLVRPDGQATFRSAAATVGQALVQSGIRLYTSDFLDPPAETRISGPLTITYRPARDLSVTADGRTISVKSSGRSVGEALAQAGLPLVGLDYSQPAEGEALPADGRIRIVRVRESVTLVQRSIPYQTETQMTDKLDLDTQNLLQPGSPGLAVSRVRIRTEDGVEVSRQAEPESIITAPVDRVIGYGTRVTKHTAKVDGITITYWRALQFWATSYHPAETGSDITASGQKVAKGLVSVDYHYIPFGTQMYVPGYGFAQSADTGGFTGRWIDLGYPDAEYVPWHQWLTVYFLWPPPAVIPYTIPAPITFKGYAPPGP